MGSLASKKSTLPKDHKNKGLLIVALCLAVIGLGALLTTIYSNLSVSGSLPWLPGQTAGYDKKIHQQESKLSSLSSFKNFYSTDGPNKATDSSGDSGGFYSPKAVVVSCYEVSGSPSDLFQRLNTDFENNGWKNITTDAPGGSPADLQTIINNINSGEARVATEYYLDPGGKYEEYRSDLTFFSLSRSKDQQLSADLCAKSAEAKHFSASTNIFELVTTYAPGQ